MTRHEANKLILKQLSQAVKANTDQRFGQLLRNLGIVTEVRNGKGTPTHWVNEFNTESSTILDRLTKIEWEKEGI
jgi:hypothetical protein